MHTFQPTLPARGATAHQPDAKPLTAISTHAPRTGSDGFTTLMLCGCVNFNPRSPHGERRSSSYPDVMLNQFQPTLPARGATRHMFPSIADIWDFNPRSPHGERRAVDKKFLSLLYFNPRSPHGERPLSSKRGISISLISTHAPRTGSDKFLRRWKRQRKIFQPTLPARGATQAPGAANKRACISTHAPRTGSDFAVADRETAVATFQPTLPARGATCMTSLTILIASFQPTLPARGATAICVGIHKFATNFNPRSPHGERLVIYHTNN